VRRSNSDGWIVVVVDEGRALILRAGTPLSRPAQLLIVFGCRTRAKSRVAVRKYSGGADLGFYFFVIEDILKVVAVFCFQPGSAALVATHKETLSENLFPSPSHDGRPKGDTSGPRPLR
jgi:hypothetical protein